MSGFDLHVALEHARHYLPAQNPLERFVHHVQDDTLYVKVQGSATFLNFLPVRRLLTQVPAEVREVVMDFEGATLVDHTFQEKVQLLADEWPDAKLRFVGLDRMRTNSEHPQATRRRGAAESEATT